MFIYGALVEHKDDEARADIDAILRGDEPPSEARARAERQAAMWEFAMGGDIAGEVNLADR